MERDVAQRKTAKAPDPVDVHVGRRVRVRRQSRGISQSNLAHTIGVTFQQVQKYERSSNRISVSKLYQIARALRSPISYFYLGLPDPEEDGIAQANDVLAAADALFSSPGGA
jgi:transcriptional regulator with XRE-family HTH domain